MNQPVTPVSTRLTLRVTPKASVDAAIGWRGEALNVKVRAVPEDGKANTAVIALLADILRVPKRALEIESGATSRNKRLRVEGLDAATVRVKIDAAIKTA